MKFQYPLEAAGSARPFISGSLGKYCHARLFAVALVLLISLMANLAQAGTTSTSVTSSGNPVVVGTVVTFTATVTLTSSGRLLAGMVNFIDGKSTLCSAVAVKMLTSTSATAGCTLSTLAFGSHSITATYYNDPSNTGSTSAIVTQSVLYNSSTVLSVAPSPSWEGQTVTLLGTVSGTSPTATINFMEAFPTHSITWCSRVTLANGAASCSVSNLTAGTHYFYAAYAGDTNHMPSTSQQILHSVTLQPSPIVTPGGTSTPVSNTAQVVDNPDANITIDSSGAVVILAPPAQPYLISASAPQNALIKLPQNQAIAFSSNSNTLRYTDLAGGALLLVRKGTAFNLEVAYGTVQIDALQAGITLPVISPNLNTVGVISPQASVSSLVIARTDTSLRLYVEQGGAQYQRLDQSPGTTQLYPGENARLDGSGALLVLALGSWQGRWQLPGDPLPAQTWLESRTRIPRLSGALARFGGTVTLLDILRDALAEMIGTPTGQLSYDSISGVLTYGLNGQYFRVIPLGEVNILLNQLAASSASSISGSAGGVFDLTSRGIQMSLAGSLGYFTDLQTALKTLDPNGQISLTPSGVVVITFSGGRYATMPGISVTLPAVPLPIPGFEVDANGLAAFRDHLGAVQTLYPAFFDIESLVSVANSLDPTATLVGSGTGWVDLSLQGLNIRLLPDYAITALPAGREANAWWVENNHLYLHNSDNSAQGFSTQ